MIRSGSSAPARLILRARFLTLALEFSKDRDPGAAIVWGNALDGFKREPRTDPPVGP